MRRGERLYVYIKYHPVLPPLFYYFIIILLFIIQTKNKKQKTKNKKQKTKNKKRAIIIIFPQPNHKIK